MTDALATATSQLTMTDAPKITVHHLPNSRSLRILMLLEELKLPYGPPYLCPCLTLST
jgi:hypothetical protein